MKRGYALKEKSKGKKNELVRKNNRNEPQTKRPGKCASSNATTVPFLKNFIVCRWLTLATVDE